MTSNYANTWNGATLNIIDSRDNSTVFSKSPEFQFSNEYKQEEICLEPGVCYNAYIDDYSTLSGILWLFRISHSVRWPSSGYYTPYWYSDHLEVEICIDDIPSPPSPPTPLYETDPDTSMFLFVSAILGTVITTTSVYAAIRYHRYKRLTSSPPPTLVHIVKGQKLRRAQV